MARLLRHTLLLALTALAFAGAAQAAGGNYVFDGGSRGEQEQVRAALNVSTFPWGIVSQQVTIHIVRGIPSSEAAPGQIWLDANLLDAGQLSWGVVQHEYAHEVDFLLLDPARRAILSQQLGGSAWDSSVPGLAHAAYGCERFASTLAWSYWPSAANVMKPQSANDESAAMPPAKFRALIAGLLDDPALASVPTLRR